ncbi:hypothetical protein AMECASPLE_018047 [Ameca splendens]|uniref:Uncharacterized protein n=1 Tax=Ameca splendens TaxID=208324 RepID=A0ABV0Y2K7_9TELE
MGHTCGHILYFKHTAILCNILERPREIRQATRKRIVDLHISGSSLGTVSGCLKIPCLQSYISKRSSPVFECCAAGRIFADTFSLCTSVMMHNNVFFKSLNNTSTIAPNPRRVVKEVPWMQSRSKDTREKKEF